MILIDAGLELVANLEQLAIARAAAAQQLGKAAPERFSREARSRHCLLFDELMQGLGNAQAADPDVIHMQVARHLESPFPNKSTNRDPDRICFSISSDRGTEAARCIQ
jgi:hypothetical protein